MNPLSDVNILTTGRIDYALITPDHFKEIFPVLLEEAAAEHEQEMSNPIMAYGHIFEDKCSKNKHLSTVFGILNAILTINDVIGFRDVYDVYLPLINDFHYKTHQLDTRLFGIVKDYIASEEYSTLSDLKKKIVDESYDNYIKSGIELPVEEKEKLKVTTDKLENLTTQFSRNITDNEAIHEWHYRTKISLKGLPADALSTAQGVAKRKGLKGYLFTMQDGNYGDLLTYADSERVRKKVYKESGDIAISGKFDNREIINRIVEESNKNSNILGYNTYANNALEDMMAKEPTTVVDFLQKLGEAAFPFAVKERQAISDYAYKVLGKDKYDFWDFSYLATKLKKELFNVDDLEVQKYLRLDSAINGLFSTIESLFNVTFEDAIKAGTATVNEKWHEDVLIYDVYEHVKVGNSKRTTKNYIATLFVDLYKRPNKRYGAWMSPEKTYHKHENGFEEMPITHVVCNFTRAAENDIQAISFHDLETLFHEFGHATHHMLSKVTKKQLGGINVEWDAVELPSQFMENFCWDYDFLKTMTSHKITGEPIPKDLFDKMVAAKNFNSGLGLLRQVMMSEMDIKTYSQVGIHPMEIEKSVRLKWQTGPIDFKSYYMPDFGHIFGGGYASLYYSYLWAEVLSADIYEAIKNDPELIHVYKKHILEVGGVNDMMDNFKTVMGREPEPMAVIRSRGLA